MADLTFKKQLQEEREDKRFEQALKELRGSREGDDEEEWADKEDLDIDLDELFSE